MFKYTAIVALFFCITTYAADDCSSFSTAGDCDASADCEAVSGEAAGSWTCEEIDCDAGAHHWSIDYLGDSTQFRLYDPCSDNRFIKIKMESLTEFTAAGVKTNNKQSQFASTGGWFDLDTDGSFDGQDAFINTFSTTLDSQAGGGAGFGLATYLFTESDSRSMKFSVNVTDWTYLATGNYLVFCVDIMTNKGGKSDDDDSSGTADTFYFDGFEFANDVSFDCETGGSTESKTVGIEETGNGKTHHGFCYSFDACDGDISYDPTATFVGGANGRHPISLVIGIALMFAALLFNQ